MFAKKLECCLIGLENSGKTTFATTIEMGPAPKRSSAPTLGLEMKTMKRGGVTFKVNKCLFHHIY